MPKFKIEASISGYSRGIAIAEIEADSEQEALSLVSMQDCEIDIIRDDREIDFDNADITEIG